MIDTKIRVIRGDHKDAQRVLNWLVDIYNAEPDNINVEYMEMQNPQTVTIVYVEGVGGIVLDGLNHLHYPNKGKIVCHYLCVEQQFRKGGIAKTFINMAKELAEKNNTEFVGAYVDSARQINLWRGLGYKFQSVAGFNIVMSIRPIATLWEPEKS